MIRHLDELGVPYAIGGSLASSFHGIPRTTQDADLVADLRPGNVQPFVAGVSEAFYVPPERVAQAVSRRSSFNLIHNGTGATTFSGAVGANTVLASLTTWRPNRVVILPIRVRSDKVPQRSSTAASSTSSSVAHCIVTEIRSRSPRNRTESRLNSPIFQRSFGTGCS